MELEIPATGDPGFCGGVDIETLRGEGASFGEWIAWGEPDLGGDDVEVRRRAGGLGGAVRGDNGFEGEVTPTGVPPFGGE